MHIMQIRSRPNILGFLYWTNYREKQRLLAMELNVHVSNSNFGKELCHFENVISGFLFEALHVLIDSAWAGCKNLSDSYGIHATYEDTLMRSMHATHKL